MSADEVVAFVKATNPTAFKNSSKSSGRITSVSRSSSHRKIKKAAGWFLSLSLCQKKTSNPN